MAAVKQVANSAPSAVQLGSTAVRPSVIPIAAFTHFMISNNKSLAAPLIHPTQIERIAEYNPPWKSMFHELAFVQCVLSNRAHLSSAGDGLGAWTKVSDELSSISIFAPYRPLSDTMLRGLFESLKSAVYKVLVEDNQGNLSLHPSVLAPSNGLLLLWYIFELMKEQGIDRNLVGKRALPCPRPPSSSSTSSSQVSTTIAVAAAGTAGTASTTYTSSESLDRKRQRDRESENQDNPLVKRVTSFAPTDSVQVTLSNGSCTTDRLLSTSSQSGIGGDNRGSTVHSSDNGSVGGNGSQQVVSTPALPIEQPASRQSQPPTAIRFFSSPTGPATFLASTSSPAERPLSVSAPLLTCAPATAPRPVLAPAPAPALSRVAASGRGPGGSPSRSSRRKSDGDILPKHEELVQLRGELHTMREQVQRLETQNVQAGGEITHLKALTSTLAIELAQIKQQLTKASYERRS